MTHTYQLAYEACGHYFITTGLMPTVQVIMDAIGIKSTTTISTAIKEWKAALAKTLQDRQAPITGLPPNLTESFVTVWQHAQAEAAQLYRDRQAQLDSQHSQLTALEQALMTEKVTIHQQVALTELRFTEEISLLKKDINRLTEEATQLKALTMQYQKTATDVEKANAVYAEQISQEREKYQQLERRFDTINHWALTRIEEEKTLYQQKIHQEMQRLKADATRSQQAAELVHAKYELSEKQVIESREKNLELEKALTHEKLKLAELTLAMAKQQEEHNLLINKDRSQQQKVNKRRKAEL